MTALKFAFVAALCLTVGAFALAQSPPDSGRNTAVVPNLRIVSPKNGQKLSADWITIQYQVTNTAAAANNMPTFNVSLDGGDAVQTSTMSHTFTGLVPGQHTVALQMVDANSLPVAGTLTQVQFVIAGPQNTPAGTTPGSQTQQPMRVRDISGGTEQPAATEDSGSISNANTQEANLPSSSSALPLLSVIGFGVLVGGIASALKTR